jgi:hypothetical protein
MRVLQKLLPFLSFYILLWFSNLTNAVGTKNNPEFPTYHAPTGSKVGVELDWQLAKAGSEATITGKPASTGKLQDRLVFMAHWTVPRTLTDVQLVQICMDGFLDMMKSGAQYDMHKDNYPTVMTVFYSGTDLILARKAVQLLHTLATLPSPSWSISAFALGS